MANELQKLSGYYDRRTAHDMDYREYMSKQAMVKDMGTAIQRSTDQQMITTAVVGANITHKLDNVQGSIVQMQTGIQTSIKAQTLAIVASQAALAHTFNQGFDRINNTLDMGFSGISNQLGDMSVAFSMGFEQIESAIEKMSKAICDRLDALHDIMNNPLLTQSRELYRRAVANYNKGFFEEALEDIKSAVEKNKTDYISWYLEGKIYSFGAGEFSNVINLDLAIDALAQAAKYNKPDIAASDDARLLAAEIWFYLGLAKYSKFNDLSFNKKEAEANAILPVVLATFERSYQYSENMLEALYNTARCKVIQGKIDDAIKDLETLVLRERNYCIKVYTDHDFSGIEGQFTKLIEKLKKAAFVNAKNKYDLINNLLSELTSLGGTIEIEMPSTFTDELPYFDILDYEVEFEDIIPVLRQAIADENEINAFETEYNEAKQKILESLTILRRGEIPKYDSVLFDITIEDVITGIEDLIIICRGDVSKWWEPYEPTSREEEYRNHTESRSLVRGIFSRNSEIWERLVNQDRQILVEYMSLAKDIKETTEEREYKKEVSKDRKTHLLIALSILIDIVGIVLAVKYGNFIIAIIGFVVGWIVIFQASRFNLGGINEVSISMSGLAGAVHLLIISFIAGFGFHSFTLGLFGIIASIVLVIVSGIIIDS